MKELKATPVETASPKLAGDWLIDHPDYGKWRNVAPPGIGGMRWNWPEIVVLMEGYAKYKNASLELELTQVREELRLADAEIAEARNEASTCDDIVLNQSLAGVIGSLQKDRERLQVELGKAEAENKRLREQLEETK